MSGLQDEQLGDLQWATCVLAGRGDDADCPVAANNMLAQLSCHGATQQIKHAASAALVSVQKEAA